MSGVTLIIAGAALFAVFIAYRLLRPAPNPPTRGIGGSARLNDDRPYQVDGDPPR